MNRQYFAQRRMGGDNPLGVGAIPIGAIFHIQDEGFWRSRYGETATCRNPWIVEAFLNGTMGAARRNLQTGMWESIFVAGRSDMAVVRSLRDGRRQQIAVRVLQLHEDHGLRLDAHSYPTRPNLDCHPRYRRQANTAACAAQPLPLAA